jgi:UDP-GlcNAc:undecaprenyl-phosphate GlcNAc-1-phosphate transferase
MTTVLFSFALALIFSLLATPLAGKSGIILGAIDLPDKRKVHTGPIPRTGGVAIFFSFLATLFVMKLFETKVSAFLVMDRQTTCFLGGMIICFGGGVIDDFHRLGPKIKLVFQIAGASVAFWGGLRIDHFSLMDMVINFGHFSYFVTLLWFLLFINAVNLMDGLDGLAGGIVLFAAGVMVFMSVMTNSFLVAMFFSALTGSILGFLWYNFHPAKIFLGDGGSYLLGYMVAGLSIMGAVKSPVGALIILPVLALGIPLLDTILSPLRRFISGKRVLSPDKDHIHHRFLKLGFTTRKSVFIIYAITLFLCSVAVVLVNIRDERAGLFLIVLGVGVVIFFRKLGYSDLINSDLLSEWFEGISEDFVLSADRRVFFDLQSIIIRSQNFEDLWQNTIRALEMLEFDKGSLYLNDPLRRVKFKSQGKVTSISNGSDRRTTLPIESSVIMRKSPPELDWIRPPFTMSNYVCSRSIFRLELPLLTKENIHLGTLILVKDTKNEPIGQHVLSRVSDLRRAVTKTMERLLEDTGEVESR